MRDDHLSWYWRWRNLYGDRFGANPFRRDEATEEPETEEAALAGKKAGILLGRIIFYSLNQPKLN